VFLGLAAWTGCARTDRFIDLSLGRSPGRVPAQARPSRVPGDGSTDAGRLERDAIADRSGTPPPPRVDVLTQHDDLGRTGANLRETTLSVAEVRSGRFGKLFARTVDDQIYAQPLVVSALDVPGRGPTDVVFVATVNDTLYAFDASDPQDDAPIWSRRLVKGSEVPPRNTDMTGACNGHYTDFSGNIGIVGTPVIDRDSGTLYAVARTKEDGNFVQKLHAVDIRDGTERDGSPVTITASIEVDGGSPVAFDPLHENQRAALTLVSGVVYVAWAGHCDWPPYHGWILGYDATTLERVVAYSTTPRGSAGGVWQSGQGLASDGTALFAVVGNGTVGVPGDPRSLVNRGESILKLVPSGGTLAVESYFTPYDYATLDDQDLDLGSAGALLVPDSHLAVTGGKGGWLYVVDRDRMGGLTTSTTADDNVVQTFDVSSPDHIQGSPVFWKGPRGSFVYVWAQNNPLKAFPYLGAAYAPGTTVLDVDHVVTSSVVAPFGEPGGLLSISADGSNPGSGIVWASRPLSGDANQEVRPGIFHAFDAETLGELWNSRQNAARDDCGNFAKFSYPTVANGRVYLASFSGQLCVYGLE
jgi:hypothetical protein